MNSRSVLRAEAKKLYKEQVKGVPKKQRLPFAEFFKQYKALKLNESKEDISSDDDFDFDNIINVNEISDDNLETIVEDEK